MENDQEELLNDIPKLKLKAKKSKISGQPGVVRIHQSQLSDVDFDAGALVELTVEGKVGKGVVVKVIADKLMTVGYASIRKEDMSKIKVDENDEVILINYKKYKDTLREGYEKIKSRFKKKKEDEEESD